MKTLNLMDFNFNLKASFTGFETALMNRVWNGIDTLEFTINSDVTNAKQIAVDDLIWFDHEFHKAFIVERVNEVLQGSTLTFEVFAVGLNTLLKDFITVPPSGQEFDTVTGNRETVVRTWVNNNCINSPLTVRNQYPIVLDTNGNKGATVTELTRFTNLQSEIARILEPDDLSSNLVLDIKNKRFIFTVNQGVDRTAIQTTNSRILFGMEYGNIAGYNKVTDKTSERNVVFVGGEGEGALQTVEIVGTPTGRRKEMFLNAGSSAEVPLGERGLQALAENKAVKSFEFEALERQFVYQKDFDLGDYVTLVINRDTIEHLQIRGVEEVYEKGNVRVIPHFGKTEKTISNMIGNVLNRITVLETN